MSLSKDPAEIVTVTFDFSDDATAVSNPIVSIDVVSGLVDANPGAMISGDPQISGTNVMQRIVGGNNGTTYKLRCVADDADGERYVRSDTMEVQTF